MSRALHCIPLMHEHSKTKIQDLHARSELDYTSLNILRLYEFSGQFISVPEPVRLQCMLLPAGDLNSQVCDQFDFGFCKVARVDLLLLSVFAEYLRRRASAVLGRGVSAYQNRSGKVYRRCRPA